MEKLEVLGTLPLFEPLSSAEAERLADGCRMPDFRTGHGAVPGGRRADGMHVVLRGVVKVVGSPRRGRSGAASSAETPSGGRHVSAGHFPASAVMDDVETLYVSAEAFLRAGDGEPGTGPADAGGVVAAPADIRPQARGAGAGRGGRTARHLSAAPAARSEARTSSGGVSAKCWRICSGWPVKPFRQLSRFVEAGLVELKERTSPSMTPPPCGRSRRRRGSIGRTERPRGPYGN